MDNNNKYTFPYLEQYIQDFFKESYVQYKKEHSYGNEDVWDDNGEREVYKEVLTDNIKDIIWEL